MRTRADAWLEELEELRYPEAEGWHGEYVPRPRIYYPQGDLVADGNRRARPIRTCPVAIPAHRAPPRKEHEEFVMSQGTLVPKPGHTSHQRKMHRQVLGAGYRFLKTDSRNHNVYVNDHKQRVIVPGTPKNEGHAERFTRSEIKRHKEALATKEAPVSTSAVSEATKFIAMAEPIMLSPPASIKEARRRNEAFNRWMKRVLEKYGPVPSRDLMDAVEQMGFTVTTHVTQAKKAINAISFRGDHQDNKRWMICLDYQLPEGKQRIQPHPKSKTQVEVEEPTLARSGRDIEAVIPGTPLMPQIVLNEMPTRHDIVPDLPVNGNGVPSETSAAALLLLESLGIKAPGVEAREALVKARKSLQESQAAVDNALALLG